MKACILDRDATLIDVVRDDESGVITTAFHPAHVRILPGVVEGLRILRDDGYIFAVASNQPGPAKGHFRVEAVERANAALVDLLRAEGIEIAHVECCFHHPEGTPQGDPSLIGECACRKPKPGLLLKLQSRLGFDPKASWMVGDNEGDVRAGAAAGLKTGLIFALNRCELCPLRAGVSSLERIRPDVRPDVHGANLVEVANQIVAFA